VNKANVVVVLAVYIPDERSGTKQAVEGIGQFKELREIAEQGDDGRDVEGEIELYDHSIKFKLHPSAQLCANGKEICTLKFDVETDLELQAIKLEMKNACVTQIKAGKLKSTTELKFNELPLMTPCEKTIDLPLRCICRSGASHCV
jgi:hypothetical protein